MLFEGQKNHLGRVVSFILEQSAGRMVREAGGKSAECGIPKAKEEVDLLRSESVEETKKAQSIIQQNKSVKGRGEKGE